MPVCKWNLGRHIAINVSKYSNVSLSSLGFMDHIDSLTHICALVVPSDQRPCELLSKHGALKIPPCALSFMIYSYLGCMFAPILMNIVQIGLVQMVRTNVFIRTLCLFV